MLSNWMRPALKSKCRLPVGSDPLVLRIVKPKFAFPIAEGLAGYAPGGELIHPPPVTAALPGVGVTVGVIVGVLVGVFVGVFVGVSVGV